MPRFALPLSLCAAGLLWSATPTQAAPTRRQLPADVQQDPAARVMRLQQLRSQIVQRVKALTEDRYRRVVRPSLGSQLRQLGFDEQDVTYFLTDLDRTRDCR